MQSFKSEMNTLFEAKNLIEEAADSLEEISGDEEVTEKLYRAVDLIMEAWMTLNS